MLKKLQIFVLMMIFSSFAIGQTGTITPVIDGSFIQGISASNTFYVTDVPLGTEYVDFYILDENDETLSYLEGDFDGQDYLATFDMGIATPGAVVYVVYYDADLNELDHQEFPLNVLAKPAWLENFGTATNVVQDGNIINFTAELLLASAVQNYMPNNIPGLKDKAYNLTNSRLALNVSFDCTTALSQVSLANLHFDLNVLDQKLFNYSYPIELAGIVLDENLNFAINAFGEYNTTEFNINFPLFTFMAGPVPVKIDGGVKFQGALSGRIVFGYNEGTSSWGFIEINGDVTNVKAKLTGEGFLRAKADILIASASGSIIVRGSVGGGFEYRSFPSETITPLFGGNVQIAGAIDYKLGVGWFSTKGRFEHTFYDNTWGDPMKSEELFTSVDAFGNYTRTIQRNPAFEVTEFFPQPAFAANTEKFYTVWLEKGTNGKQNLMFSELDYFESNFLSAKQILSNKENVSNPQLAILESGSCLITWSENRFNSENTNLESVSIEDILQAQDIWACVYDVASETFIEPFMLSDDMTNFYSGRAEGQASVTMGLGSEGLITWVVKDMLDGTSEIFYATITETTEYWSFGEPASLSDFPGVNRSVNVSYFDDTNAIAVWINDPDADDETLNEQVLYRLWNGISWSEPYILVENQGFSSYENLSTSFNDLYGAVAVTGTDYNTDGTFEKRIFATTWDNVNDNWGELFIDTDTEYYFQNPKISVSYSGIVALTYQAVELYTDTETPDNGDVYLLLNNSELNPNNWVEITGDQYVGNDDTYAWDINASFGNTDVLFLMTQEADNITGGAPLNPSNGVRFANLDLNLVLRAFVINSDLTISDAVEPTTESTVTIKDLNYFDYSFSEVFPNPFSDFAIIKYTLNKKSNVKIEVLDLFGKQVALLADNELNAGVYQTNFQPKAMSSGIYLCRITVDGYSYTKKMIKK